MKAIGLTTYGGPDVLRELELPTPEAGPGEVRIRVHAAAVNPTDVMMRTGGHAVRLRDVPPPYVPGMDAAGVIDQIGPGVDGQAERGAAGRRPRDVRPPAGWRVRRTDRRARGVRRARARRDGPRRGVHPPDERRHRPAGPRHPRPAEGGDRRRDRRGGRRRRLRDRTRQGRRADRRRRRRPARPRPGARLRRRPRRRPGRGRRRPRPRPGARRRARAGGRLRPARGGRPRGRGRRHPRLPPLAGRAPPSAA